MAKILMVDDSAYARRVHRSMLERAGHTVVEASTGAGAIETFVSESPDLVLLDLSMEDIGGVQVLRTLREMNAAARVIVLSADVQRSTEDAVLEAGGERFLAKPVDESSLMSAITDVLGTVGP
jgi:two-component system chemotaxis response regulator CheY